MRLTLDQAIARYGKIENGKWADETKWMISHPLPDFVTGWINSATGAPAHKIYCNKDLAPLLDQALTNLRDRGLLSELKTFDGCFLIRDVRGLPGHPSTHSFGLAIDLNASENKLGETPKLSPEFVKCFTDAGFSWGGNFTRKDGMHFSAAWE